MNPESNEANDRFHRGFKTTRLLITAGVICAALVVIILFNSTPGSKNPYQSYLDSEKAPFLQIRLRGDKFSDAQQLFYEGMKEYRRDNFNGAIQHLEKAVDKTPDQGDWWLYLGVSYYLNHKSERAIEALTRADLLLENSQKWRARWFLTQAFLLSGDADKAVPLLKKISNRDDEYAEKAKRLLSQVQAIAENRN